MNAKLSIWLQCTSSSLWQFVLEGRYLFFMWYLPGVFSIFGENKNKYMGRAVFQGRAWMITNYIFLYGLRLPLQNTLQLGQRGLLWSLWLYTRNLVAPCLIGCSTPKCPFLVVVLSLFSVWYVYNCVLSVVCDDIRRGWKWTANRPFP